jgi:hypothetical protein
MTTKAEVLFVDRAVPDLDLVLSELRPGVEAVVLDRGRPVARQIAEALADRRGLEAVHVMAHGSPGRVNFAAGDWTAATVTDDSGELSAIGRALAAGGDLRLWSCGTAYGRVGAAFLDALAEAACADVAAATDRVGAADKGGAWLLSARATAPSPQPPITPAGVEAYAGVLSARAVVSGPLSSDPTQAGAHVVVDKATHAVLGQFTLPLGSDEVRRFRLVVALNAWAEAYDVGVLSKDGRFASSGFAIEPPRHPQGAVGATRRDLS